MFLVLLQLALTVQATIRVSTTINDRKIDILKNGQVHESFSPANVHESTCHPSPLFIEESGPGDRSFNITNEGTEVVSITFDTKPLLIPPNTTMTVQHLYRGCENHEQWVYELVPFEHDMNFIYIRMCHPMSSPTHPLVVLLVVSISLVLIGSIYGQQHMSIMGEEQNERVDSKMAVWFLVVSSAGLLSLYLFADYLKMQPKFLSYCSFLLVWVMMVGFTALMNLLRDIGQWLNYPDGPSVSLPHFGKTTLQQGISASISISIILAYVITKNWMLSNFLAFALTLLLFKVCIRLQQELFEIDSLRTASILCTLAFFYDIFWVFFSPIFFGKSVMATVATQIDLPMKFQCPEFLTQVYPVSRCSLIGLGDIILPGVLLKYLYKCDRLIQQNMLFPVAYAGYAVGLVMCMYCLIVYKLAQPALLYLVPCILLPVFIVGCKSNHFRMIWSGDIERLSNKPFKQVDQDYELSAGEI